MIRFAAAVITALLLAGCATPASIKEQQKNEKRAQIEKLLQGSESGKLPVRNLTAAEQKVFERAVQRELKDPNSARFGWLPLVGNESEAQAYCGRVNARNAFGGYAGDAPYLASILRKNNRIKEAVVIAIGNANPNSSDTMAVKQQCLSHGYLL